MTAQAAGATQRRSQQERTATVELLPATVQSNGNGQGEGEQTT